MTPKLPPLWAHQAKTLELLKSSPIVFDTSDPGTGKTRAALEAFLQRGKGKALVLAPKTLLESAWAADIKKWTPALNASVAYAHNREEAFAADADVYITNVDAVKWLAKQSKKFFNGFETIIVDECFPAGTLVDTPYGPTTIETLKPNDLVFTSSGALPISAIMKRECTTTLITLEFDDGVSITCTENHPFATTKGWVEAGKLWNMSVLRLDLHKLHQQRAAILQPQLQPQSILGKQNSSRTPSNSSKISSQATGENSLEQRSPLRYRDQSQTKCGAQGLWAQTTSARWERPHSSMRANDGGDSFNPMGIPVRDPNEKTSWYRISNFIQTRFRATRQALGFGDRRELTSIAKRLGCEERFIAGISRVERITRYEPTSPCLVYNLQVNGPHTYSVAGRLVHNCTAYKHRTSARSKAAAKIIKGFAHRELMTGTPNSNTVLDVWHQALLLDGGERLGRSYYQFRSAVCEPVQVGPQPNHLKWQDKPGAELIVAELLKDISIRHEFADCMDIPPNHTYTVSYELSKSLMQKYKKLERESILELEKTDVTAVNAAALRGKLLQLASGAVYYSENKHEVLDTGRYELIADLIEARRHSIVFFNWRHQREQISKELEKRGVIHEVIDGNVPQRRRAQIVEAYQAGYYQTLLLHPQTGAHGLTLTRGTATIWASPIYQPDFLKQGMHRIFRGGQTEKTETILIEAKGTVEKLVYERLSEKSGRMQSFLDLLKERSIE